MLVDTDQSVRAAGGYILQLLPGAPDDIIDRLEAGIQAAGAATAMLDAGLTGAQMLEKVLDGFEEELLETQPIEYCCYCSRARVESTLVSLGKDDLEQVVANGETLHVDCQFCDRVYDFTPQDVAKILEKLV